MFAENAIILFDNTCGFEILSCFSSANHQPGSSD